MTTERLTAADGPQGDDWATLPVAAEPTETPEVRAARQRIAQECLSHAIHRIQEGVSDLNSALASAMEGAADDLQYDVLAETVAWLQDMRRTLGEAEGYVARELGRMDGVPEQITLTDGRMAEVLRGKDRKEWRHADWQRDVRQAVIPSDLPDTLVDPATGEAVAALELTQQAVAAAQEVHGAGAPKIKALKALGLQADDYCTTYPGPYSVRVSAPATTTQEK